MLLVHHNALLLQLLLQAGSGHGIAQEQVDGFLVVHKVAHGVGVGELAALGHGLGVVVGILNDFNALAAQQVFLPLAGVGGHVHLDLEADGGAADADGQAQVAGGAHLHGVLVEECAHLVAAQLLVVVSHFQLASCNGQILGVFQHLIDAAAGLDRACHRQMAVHLEEQIAGDGAARCFDQAFLHLGDGLQRGLDDAIGALGLREALADERGKPLQTRLCICNVCVRDDQLAHSVGHFKGQELGVDPQSLFLLRDLL